MAIFLENTKLAIHSILANKVRSLLTILGVVIGVFAIITIIAIGSGLQEDIVSQITSLGADVLDIVPGEVGGDSLMSSAVGLQEKFTQDEIDHLRKEATLLSGVAEMYEFSGSVSFANNELSSLVIGTDPIYFSFRGLGAQEGQLFNKNDNISRDRKVVLGFGAAEKLFGNPQNSLNQSIKINGKEFKVIGVLEKESLGFGGFQMNNSVYLPSLTTAKYFPDVGIMEIIVKVRDENEVVKAQRQVEIALKEVMGDKKFTVMGQDTMLDLVESITGVITSALAGLASISLVVGGIGIMNIMLVSVTERTKEIGIRKAIGANDSHILVQFLTESIVLCLAGGLIGLLIATGVSAILTEYFSLPTLVNMNTVVGAISFSIGIGVIFGTAPALKAARKDPVDALRYE